MRKVLVLTMMGIVIGLVGCVDFYELWNDDGNVVDDDDSVADDDTTDDDSADDDTVADDDTASDDDTADDDSAGDDDDTEPASFCDAPTGVLVFEDDFEADYGQFAYYTSEQEFVDMFAGDPSVDFSYGAGLNLQEVTGPYGNLEHALALMNELPVDPSSPYIAYANYSENISVDLSAVLAYGETYTMAVWVRTLSAITWTVHTEESMDTLHSSPPDVDDVSVSLTVPDIWECITFTLVQQNADDVWEDAGGTFWPVPINHLTFLSGNFANYEKIDLAHLAIYRQ